MASPMALPASSFMAHETVTPFESQGTSNRYFTSPRSPLLNSRVLEKSWEHDKAVLMPWYTQGPTRSGPFGSGRDLTVPPSVMSRVFSFGSYLSRADDETLCLTKKLCPSNLRVTGFDEVIIDAAASFEPMNFSSLIRTPPISYSHIILSGLHIIRVGAGLRKTSPSRITLP